MEVFGGSLCKSPLGLVDAELVDGNEAIYHTLWPRNSALKKFAGVIGQMCLSSFVNVWYDTAKNGVSIVEYLRIYWTDFHNLFTI